ncbi:hypothetical protein [Embleya sp. NBC_00896]|uniref:hypothetical protein n=1 Tax=Embleya sp. NBC_00896 TaxID=2975961 RepID=UPI0038669365|nr:hypothetical protein OG928_00300 [Embleya sp. NBC_00896]
MSNEGEFRKVRQASLDDVRVRAVIQTLGPYGWRRLTPEMVSRRALAAVDGHVATGTMPVTRHDERIEVLLEFLGCCSWRTLTVDALSRRLVTALDTWRTESHWLEIELRWLLDADD